MGIDHLKLKVRQAMSPLRSEKIAYVGLKSYYYLFKKHLNEKKKVKAIIYGVYQIELMLLKIYINNVESKITQSSFQKII